MAKISTDDSGPSENFSGLPRGTLFRFPGKNDVHMKTNSGFVNFTDSHASKVPCNDDYICIPLKRGSKVTLEQI